MPKGAAHSHDDAGAGFLVVPFSTSAISFKIGVVRRAVEGFARLPLRPRVGALQVLHIGQDVPQMFAVLPLAAAGHHVAVSGALQG